MYLEKRKFEIQKSQNLMVLVIYLNVNQMDINLIN